MANETLTGSVANETLTRSVAVNVADPLVSSMLTLIVITEVCMFMLTITEICMRMLVVITEVFSEATTKTVF